VRGKDGPGAVTTAARGPDSGAAVGQTVSGRGGMAKRAAREVRAALRPFTIPNGITLLRLALTPFFVLAILSRDHLLALGLFAVAGISDVLDGLVARWLSMPSRLGTYLDPIADKLLLVTAYVVLTLPMPGSVTIPLWLTVLALSRDFLIVLVALLLYLGADVVEFPPSLWGKATTFIHVVTLALVLIANVTRVAEYVLLTCFYLALTLTVISGVDYIRRVAKRLEAIHDEQRR
jgi:cardiolipin synthase